MFSEEEIYKSSYYAEPFIIRSIEEIDRYIQVFKERILTAFESLPEEAEQIARDEYARLNRELSGERYDGGDIALFAEEKGLRYNNAMRDTRQGIVNLFAAGLFHMFEQQAIFLVNRVLPKAKSDISKNSSIDDLKKCLKDQKVNLDNRVFWRKMNELRLIANIVKHGEGKSEVCLRKIRPDIFRSPKKMDIKPLVGEGLNLKPEDVYQYGEQIRSFWNELSIKLKEVFLPNNLSN
jgi:hypothetical protein